MSFDSLGLHPTLLRALPALNLLTPTPIQLDAIPLAIAGRDILASANTGSGKTAAFMLPTLHRLLNNPTNTTRVLILSPTRELADQIQQATAKLAGHTKITSTAIFGGVPMGPQIQALRRNTHILVATPGRLLDHLRNPYANLNHIDTVILDEADRMLDMGFLPDIRKILARIPANRQTLLFSATLPSEIRALSKEFMRDPVLVDKAVKGAPATSITQAVYPVPHHLKSALLVRLLADEDLESVIVFTRTKARADRVARVLRAANISCAPIHGDRSQGQRLKALAAFKRAELRVLVATDVAARGLDIADVSHVINLDCPPAPEDYIHRVGRTGRAAATGDAFTFVSSDEEQHLRLIQRALGKALPRITLENFDYAKVPAVPPQAAHHQQKHKAHAHQPAHPFAHHHPRNKKKPGRPNAWHAGRPAKSPKP